MLYPVHKSLDKPSSFMWFKGRFLLIPAAGITFSIVLILILQVVLPVLLASILCILCVLIPSIVIGLRLQDKVSEKNLPKLLFPSKRNLRISIPPSSIKREYIPSALTYIIMTKGNNNIPS